MIVFHLTKGTPFDDDNQNRNKNLTFWEQIDGGVQFSGTRKFLTAVPVLLYALSPAGSTARTAPPSEPDLCRATTGSGRARTARGDSFLLSTHFADYDATAFGINLVSLIVVLVPKYPAMHKFRWGLGD